MNKAEQIFALCEAAGKVTLGKMKAAVKTLGYKQDSAESTPGTHKSWLEAKEPHTLEEILAACVTAMPDAGWKIGSGMYADKAVAIRGQAYIELQPEEGPKAIIAIEVRKGKEGDMVRNGYDA